MKTLTKLELVELGKDRAQANYDTYHWFVECYTDSQWLDFADGMTTQKELFDLMDRAVSVWNDRCTEW